MTRQSWDEDTRPNLLRQSLQQRVAESKPPEDDDSTLGMLMRQTVQNTVATAQNTQAIGSLRTDFDVLAREVRQHTRGATEIAAGTAKHASNRVAILLSALFTAYEVTSPYLREIWRQLVHK